MRRLTKRPKPIGVARIASSVFSSHCVLLTWRAETCSRSLGMNTRRAITVTRQWRSFVVSAEIPEVDLTKQTWAWTGLMLNGSTVNFVLNATTREEAEEKGIDIAVSGYSCIPTDFCSVEVAEMFPPVNEGGGLDDGSAE